MARLISSKLVRYLFCVHLCAIFGLGHALVIGKDDGRVALRELIAASDYEQIFSAMGWVACPGTRFKNPSATTGTLLGHQQVLVTVAHAFYDERGRAREPLTECFFLPFNDLSHKVPLNLDNKNAFFESRAPHLDKRKDRVFLKLPYSIPQTKFIPVMKDSLSDGAKILFASVIQEGMKASVDHTAPVGQICQVQYVFTPFDDIGTVMYTDCDLDRGGSGGVGLVKHLGQWYAVATFNSFEGRDGQEFHLEKTWSRALGFDLPHHEIIRRLTQPK